MLSPIERFTDIKSNALTDLRVSFGTYVQTHDRNTKNDMSPRTSGCIALLGTGSPYGAVKFMNLHTHEVVTRDAWTELPITDEVISHINGLSETSTSYSKKDPSVTYGNGMVVGPPDPEDSDVYNDDFQSMKPSDVLTDVKIGGYSVNEAAEAFYGDIRMKPKLYNMRLARAATIRGATIRTMVTRTVDRTWTSSPTPPLITQHPQNKV